MAYTDIDKPTDYFNTVLYTGNGTDAHAITGVGFSPDFVWLKGRSVAEHHTLNDTVRGANKQLFSNLTYGESTETDRLQSFDSDGFTLGTDVIVNQSSQTFASWNWLAGGTGSSNTDGSITSSVSASTDAGFSIVTYTGTGSSATVGHGLGVAPNVIITKKRNGTVQWNFQNSMRGYNEYMALNTTEASQATGGAIISAVSSTTYSCDGNDVVNASSGTYVSYCFAEKKGYSKFGSYSSNNSLDGPFIYTGFKPAFVMIKRTDTSSDWNIMDDKRAVSFNPNTKELYANSNQAEATGGQTIRDYLSNGFKLRHSDTRGNTSGITYIYMAFAENPFVTSNGVPATAR